jgi:APA family basic amino acid/polyamine antiporter
MSSTHTTSSAHLVRALGLGYVIVVTIANILGSGVYKKVAPMADQLGSSGWVLVAWVLGGLITLFGALSTAEVAGMLADTGGDYAYYKKIYNRFLAFMFGWTLFIVAQTASASSLAYVVAQSFQALVPLPPLFENLADVSILGVFHPFADLSTKLFAVAVIVILTWYNTFTVKTGVWLSNAILWTIYIGIGAIILFGLTSPQADVSQALDFTLDANHTVNISTMFTAMLAAFWAYQGWATAGYMGGEVADAHRNLPRGIVIGTLVVIGIYLLVNLTYLSLLSIDDLKGVHAADNEIAAVDAVRVFWGEKGVVFISVLIFLTTLGCTHATLYGSARPNYAMAREGLFFRSVDKLNKFNVPARALWLQCLWACILVFSGTFDQLTDMVIFSIFTFYGLTTLGVFILRKRMPDTHRPYKVWGYPVVPAIFILFCVGLIVNTFITQPREAFLGTLLVLSGVPMFAWFTRKGRNPA